jgi:chromosome segregation ATPase
MMGKLENLKTMLEDVTRSRDDWKKQSQEAIAELVKAREEIGFLKQVNVELQLRLDEARAELSRVKEG